MTKGKKKRDLINLTWHNFRWNVCALSEVLSQQKSTNCHYCNGQLHTTYLLRFMPSVCIEGGLVAVRVGKAWWIVRGGATLVGLSTDDPRVLLGRGGGALVGGEERGKVGGSSWILERGVVI